MQWPLASYVHWNLRLLSLPGILTATSIVLLIAELREGKARAGKLEEDTGSHRNCKRVLLTNG